MPSPVFFFFFFCLTWPRNFQQQFGSSENAYQHVLWYLSSSPWANRSQKEGEWLEISSACLFLSKSWVPHECKWSASWSVTHPRAILYDCSKPPPAGWAPSLSWVGGKHAMWWIICTILRAGVLWGASSKVTPPNLPFPARVTIAPGWAWRSFLVRNVWGGMELAGTCTQRPCRSLDLGVSFVLWLTWQRLKSPTWVPAATAATLMPHQDPFFSPWSIWFQPLLPMVESTVGFHQGAGKSGAPQSQPEAWWQGRPSCASTCVPMCSCVIP